MLLLIDNYDSFTYNLYQYLSELGAQVEVRRNDRVTLDEIEALQPERDLRRVSPARSLSALGRVFLCWASAWDTKRSVRSTVAG